MTSPLSFRSPTLPGQHMQLASEEYWSLLFSLICHVVNNTNNCIHNDTGPFSSLSDLYHLNNTNSKTQWYQSSSLSDLHHLVNTHSNRQNDTSPFSSLSDLHHLANTVTQVLLFLIRPTPPGQHIQWQTVTSVLLFLIWPMPPGQHKQ